MKGTDLRRKVSASYPVAAGACYKDLCIVYFKVRTESS